MKNILYTIPLFTLLLACENDMQKPETQLVTTPSVCPVSHPELAGTEYRFDGITRIENITETSVDLHWDHNDGFISYHIIDFKPEGREIIKTINAPINKFTLTGLTPNKEYKILVKALDKHGFTDFNLNYKTFKTLPWPYFNNEISASFNGAQAIKLKASNNYLSNNKFSISTWFKSTNEQSSEGRIFTIHSDDTAKTLISIGVKDADLFIKYRNESGSLKTTNLEYDYTSSNWSHIAITYNGSLLTTYINGIQNKNIRVKLAEAGNFPAHIGSFSGTNQKGFIGQVDELSFFDSFLNRNDIKSLYNAGDATNLHQFRKSAKLISWFQLGDFQSDSNQLIKDVISGFDGLPINQDLSFVEDAP